MSMLKNIFKHNLKELNTHYKLKQQELLLKEIAKAISSSIYDINNTLNTISNSAHTLTNAKISIIFLYKHKENILEARASTGIDISELNELFKEHLQNITIFLTKPFLKNIQELKKENPTLFNIFKQLSTTQFLNVNLEKEGKFLGCILLGKSTHKNFTKEDQDIIKILASFASIVIENSLIHEREKQQIKNLKVLREMDKILNSTSDFKIIIDSIVDMAIELLQGTNGALLLINQHENSLDIVSSRGFDPDAIKKTKLKIGQGITGWVAQTGLPIFVNDVSKEARYYQVNPKTKSEIAVPLKIADNLIGVLNVESEHLNRFCKDDLELLTDFAASATIALKHSKSL